MFIICYRSVPLSLVVELVIYLNDNLCQHSASTMIIVKTYCDSSYTVQSRL